MRFSLFLIFVVAVYISAASYDILCHQIELEYTQKHAIVFQRAWEYCNSSPVCAKLDKMFAEFNSGINVGKYE